MLKTRLRDFLVTKDDWLFAVSDYFRSDGIRATLRYVPDENGERELNGKLYKKLDFDPAFEFMRKYRPEWVQDVHVVPESEIKLVLRPSDIIPELVNSDSRVRAIVKVLDMAGVPRTSMGVTGSMLAGLQNESSDIDFVVYGSLWFRARDAIKIAKQQEGPIVESTYFDLLFVREWDQIKEPLLRGKDTVKLKIEAEVTNADFAFDSPAYYKVEHNEIDHVLSYTHTYAGQALPGEIIEACGIIEEVGDTKRLVVGTSREPKGEGIRSLTWLEQCGYI